jgi:hypothetical protein
MPGKFARANPKNLKRHALTTFSIVAIAVPALRYSWASVVKPGYYTFSAIKTNGYHAPTPWRKMACFPANSGYFADRQRLILLLPQKSNFRPGLFSSCTVVRPFIREMADADERIRPPECAICTPESGVDERPANGRAAACVAELLRRQLNHRHRSLAGSLSR